MSHSTQNRSFRRRSQSQYLGLVWKKLNLTQQKHTFINQKKHTTIQTKTRFICILWYSAWKQRRPILVWCFLTLTYLLRHLPTYLQPWDPHGAIVSASPAPAMPVLATTPLITSVHLHSGFTFWDSVLFSICSKFPLPISSNKLSHLVLLSHVQELQTTLYCCIILNASFIVLYEQIIERLAKRRMACASISSIMSTSTSIIWKAHNMFIIHHENCIFAFQYFHDVNTQWLSLTSLMTVTTNRIQCISCIICIKLIRPVGVVATMNFQKQTDCPARQQVALRCLQQRLA